MSDNNKVAELFTEMAFFLDLKGANPFKVRAFSNGAAIIKGETRDVKTLLSTKDLHKIKGIGKGLIAAIEEYLSEGDLEELKELKEGFPSRLMELRAVPGLGVKKIKVLWETLSVGSLSELEYACGENRLLDLKGFGEKSQRSIQKGLENLALNRGRCLLPRGLDWSASIRSVLEVLSGVEAVYEVGELCRRMETLSSLDFLLHQSTEKRPDLTKLKPISPDFTFTKDPWPCMEGSTEDGIAVRVFLWTKKMPHSLEVTKLRLTGSSTFVSSLEKMGSITEGETQEAIFQNIGLEWIPPEMREGKPVNIDLVEEADIQGVFHAHTTESDGANSLKEMVEKCRELGLSYLGVSDHSQSAIYANGLKVDTIQRQRDEVRALNEKQKDVHIFHGIESDILSDGSLDYPDEILAKFDFVIASIHGQFQMNKEAMTRRICTALKNPFSTWLGHPTGRILLGRKGYDFDMEAVLETAAAFQTGIELNSSPYRLDLDWRILPQAKEKKVSIAISPDAHSIRGLEDYRYGVLMARKGGLGKKDIVNTKNVKEMAQWLQRKK